MCAVVGRDQFTGQVTALAVDPASWALNGVLVEPARRLGLGKWVPPNLIRSDSRNRNGLRLQLSADEFDGLEDAEASTLEDGVRSSYTPFPYSLPRPEVVRRVVTQTTPPGNAVFNSSTPVLGPNSDKVTFGGAITSGQNQIQRLLVLRQRFIGHSEQDIPVSAVTVTDRGIRVDR